MYTQYNSPFFKEGFPEIKEENKGKFTAWAKKNGFKDACSAASAVMSSKIIIAKKLLKWLTTLITLVVKNKICQITKI